MDNKKIGKLIAKLRNEKELTQEELGDMVGVGFRAVSKWERGITMPDIGIINELSQILGISSDELLSGELKQSKHKDKKKIPTKIKVILSIVISLLFIIPSIFIYNHNQTYTYNISSANEDEYVVKGQLTIQGNDLSIIINQLYFKDKTFSTVKIKNYEYYVYFRNNVLFGYGYIPNGEHMGEEVKNIKNFCDNFLVNYNNTIDIVNKKIKNNDLKIIINFIKEDNTIISKEIKILLNEPQIEQKKLITP